MDDAFQKMKKEKSNSVDNLVKWFQDTKLIDRSREAEEKAKKLFADVKDTSDVEMEKFKEVVNKLAAQQKKSIEEFNRKLSEEGPRLIDAIKAGFSAFREAFTKK